MHTLILSTRKRFLNATGDESPFAPCTTGEALPTSDVLAHERPLPCEMHGLWHGCCTIVHLDRCSARGVYRTHACSAPDMAL